MKKVLNEKQFLLSRNQYNIMVQFMLFRMMYDGMKHYWGIGGVIVASSEEKINEMVAYLKDHSIIVEPY